MQINKTITKWITGAALAGALLFATPKKADAQVSFGISVGHPYYGYGYGYRPYYRPYPVYGYPPPVYGYYHRPYYGGYYHPYGYRRW